MTTITTTVVVIIIVITIVLAVVDVALVAFSHSQKFAFPTLFLAIRIHFSQLHVTNMPARMYVRGYYYYYFSCNDTGVENVFLPDEDGRM